MSIEIGIEKNKKVIYNVSKQYYNNTPFTNPSNLQIISMRYRVGYLNTNSKLKINKEYDLDFYNDFIETNREKQVKQNNGLIYDNVEYIDKISFLKMNRINKINKIL